jgi:isopentenyl diphosphate isomerase/L-lactate dehydrogenase-like FMN-dependent dehydrogenase
MASGNPVVHVLAALTPATVYATLDIRLGGSTPVESVEVFDFDASAIEYMDFKCVLRGYGGGGLTFTLPYSMTSATTGGVRLEVGIRRMVDDAEDIDAAHTYDFNGVTDTVASLAGELSYPVVTFTDGADMDSWTDGEVAIVRVRRKIDDAGDDATGDLELWAVIGKET